LASQEVQMPIVNQCVDPVASTCRGRRKLDRCGSYELNGVVVVRAPEPGDDGPASLSADDDDSTTLLLSAVSNEVEDEFEASSDVVEEQPVIAEEQPVAPVRRRRIEEQPVIDQPVNDVVEEQPVAPARRRLIEEQPVIDQPVNDVVEEQPVAHVRRRRSPRLAARRAAVSNSGDSAGYRRPARLRQIPRVCYKGMC